MIMRRSPVFCIPAAQPERQASSLVRRSRRSCSVPATLMALWEVGKKERGGHLRQSPAARCNTNTSGPLRRTCAEWSAFDCNLCCRAESLTVTERDGLLVQIKTEPGLVYIRAEVSTGGCWLSALPDGIVCIDAETPILPDTKRVSFRIHSRFYTHLHTLVAQYSVTTLL